jgi:hypothetical protein
MTRTIDHGPDKGADTFAWDESPASRIETVQALLDPIDPETGEHIGPLISRDEAMSILKASGHPMRHPADGRVHVSELALHAKSPAHVRLACTRARETTRAMRVGHIADGIVFGTGKFEVYEGDRRGAKWQTALTCCQPGRELVTSSEYEDAEGAALAVRADPVAQSLLAGCEFQRVAQWEMHGLPFASGIAGERGGFDAVRTAIRDSPKEGWGIDPDVIERVRRGYLCDLKVTSDVEPRALQRHSWRMLWPAKAAAYLEGARGIGLDVQDFYLICAEAQPPHCVTVLRLSEAALEMGRKQVAMWCERHRQCEAAGEWPGFVQSVTELEPEVWMVEGDEE